MCVCVSEMKQICAFFFFISYFRIELCYNDSIYVVGAASTASGFVAIEFNVDRYRCAHSTTHRIRQERRKTHELEPRAHTLTDKTHMK